MLPKYGILEQRSVCKGIAPETVADETNGFGERFRDPNYAIGAELVTKLCLENVMSLRISVGIFEEVKSTFRAQGVADTGIGGMVTHSPPSRPGELHPEPLTEPNVNLSAYPARATREGCRLPARQGVPPVSR
jgi:hypothetical protein